MNSPQTSRWQDFKGVWSVAWRALLFGPAVVPLGYALLFLTAASLVVPPVWVGVSLYLGEYFRAILVLFLWLASLKISPRLLDFIFSNWGDDG